MSLLAGPLRRGLCRPLRVGLVNNMPDSAFADTERQFRALLAASGQEVELLLCALPSVPRSRAAITPVHAGYQRPELLRHKPPDALIITGTEPRAADLRAEPYWGDLARLLEWAVATVPTVMVSCLAAHAAALLFDGIERVRLPAKCAGVFAGTLCDGAAGLAASLPRERWPARSWCSAKHTPNTDG